MSFLVSEGDILPAALSRSPAVTRISTPLSSAPPSASGLRESPCPSTSNRLPLHRFAGSRSVLPRGFCRSVLFAARSHASEASPYRSAPEMSGGSGHFSRTADRSTSPSKRNFLVSALNTFSCASRVSGVPTNTSRSKRPGRNRPASTRSGRFVAPTTNTSPPEESSPSTSASSWLTMRSETPPESEPRPRAGARASSSSKNITHGRAARARTNRSRTFFSLSPTYMFSSSGPLTEMKLQPHSLATAFASRVLPLPGGPYRRSPLRLR
mmetsp:Transcript_12660/g.38743  ORF Transcript_12660/g.38743 Transcript_12660/m.38743 type:complete len:268 (+) Transcript_12660:2284-3087(+)